METTIKEISDLARRCGELGNQRNDLLKVCNDFIDHLILNENSDIKRCVENAQKIIAKIKD